MNGFFGLLAVVALSIVAIVAMILGKETGISFLGLKIGVSSKYGVNKGCCDDRVTPVEGLSNKKTAHRSLRLA